VTEAIADLHRIGADAAAAEAAATAAVDAYAAAADAIDDVQVLATTPLFSAVAAPIAQLARGQHDGEIILGYDALHGPTPATWRASSHTGCAPSRPAGGGCWRPPRRPARSPRRGDDRLQRADAPLSRLRLARHQLGGGPGAVPALFDTARAAVRPVG
jgi:hypothetical protein